MDLFQRTVNADMVKELIKMMKMSCGKFGSANKLFCLIATLIWIVLQDPKKKQVNDCTLSKHADTISFINHVKLKIILSWYLNIFIDIENVFVINGL